METFSPRLDHRGRSGLDIPQVTTSVDDSCDLNAIIQPTEENDVSAECKRSTVLNAELCSYVSYIRMPF
jgi:hypothetical protein